MLRTRSTLSSAAVSQSICRIIVLGIPQHPAVSAKVFSSPDLLHDFSGGKRPPVESVISESLQPWPEADRRQPAPFLGPCKRTIDDFIGMRYGIGASRNPEVKAGWVEHGREIIEMRSDSFRVSDRSLYRRDSNTHSQRDLLRETRYTVLSFLRAASRKSAMTLTLFSCVFGMEKTSPRASGKRK